MIIDFTELFNLEREEIKLEGLVSFPDTYFVGSAIKGLGPVTIQATCLLDDGNVVLRGTLSGEMLIEDAISLELIRYPFSLELDECFEEKDRNNEKSLDITDNLWQNIVLEVPLKQTEVTDFKQYQGDGWKLVTEEDVGKTENPFSELANMWGEE